MRRVVDMKHQNEVGFIDWEFIHDMQDIVPDQITSELIFLDKKFLAKIPAKWNKIKKMLIDHLLPNEKIVPLAISDIENMGNEFKLRGTIQNEDGTALGFHKVIVMDKDRFQDDYIGAVISDEKGDFTLSFGKQTFSDFGLEQEPDIYFKIFKWNGSQFIEIEKIMPEVSKRSVTDDKHTIYEFGVITV